MNEPQLMAGRAHPTCRLIVDRPAPGAWNMAVDEALLDAAVEQGVAALRFYQWSEPTLSLGYFQRHADRDSHAASHDCTLVRRQSGGGAILHDRELTYSLTLPPGHPLARHAEQPYAAVHQALVELLTPHLPMAGSPYGLRICVKSSSSSRCPQPQDAEPFLCFQRRAAGDVLLVAGSAAAHASQPPSAWKLVGSAQRRHRGAILQHGSLLVERSPAAPELPGWRDLTGTPLPIDTLLVRLPELLASRLSVAMEPASLPTGLREAAAKIERERYASRSWTLRR